MILRKYQIFHSSELPKVEGHLRAAVAGSVRRAHLISGGDGFRCNAIGLGIMPICYLESDIAGTFDFQPLDYIRLMFQTRGASRVTVDEGMTTNIGERGGSYIIPEGQSVREENPSGFRSLAVRIEPSELKQKLVALCGVDVSKPVIFEQSQSSNQKFADFVRKPLFAAAREMDESDPRFHQNLMEEIKNITLTRLLLFAPHNFSDLLERESGAPGQFQMAKAEEYIAANWDRNIEVAALAEVVGVSGRTILRYFREKHGETPRDYIRRIRLERARQMLLAGGDDMTVVGVAIKCGFSSLGHFAESYRNRFGELPSKTLKHGR